MPFKNHSHMAFAPFIIYFCLSLMNAIIPITKHVNKKDRNIPKKIYSIMNP